VQSFDDATVLEQHEADTFGWTVPDGWQQGRGAWGGLVIGATIKAVEASETDTTRTVRSISANLVAPAVVGAHTVQTECVRRGSTVATWAATLRDVRGRIVAVGTVIMGAPRALVAGPDFSTWGSLASPDVLAAAEVDVLPLRAPLGPVFAQHIEARVVSGIPTEAGEVTTLGWIDYATPVPATAASLLALVDAWWPASLVALDAMRPIATVAFAANLMVDPATVGLVFPLIHHGEVTSAIDGYTSEHRRLWTADGRLVVDNLQSIVLVS